MSNTVGGATKHFTAPCGDLFFYSVSQNFWTLDCPLSDYQIQTSIRHKHVFMYTGGSWGKPPACCCSCEVTLNASFHLLLDCCQFHGLRVKSVITSTFFLRQVWTRPLIMSDSCRTVDDAKVAFQSCKSSDPKHRVQFYDSWAENYEKVS